MRKQVRGTPLVAEGDWDTKWSIEAPPVAELKRLLGMPLLIELCRLSVAADRLLSLGDFALFNHQQRQDGLDILHARNLQTMFWLVCGTLHEAIDAITETEMLGIEGLLASFEDRRPWIELRTFAARWNDDPIYRRVRNKIAFHLDRTAIRKGINKREDSEEPVIWKSGNTKRERSTMFQLPQDCLLSVLFPGDPTEKDASKHFGEFSGRVRDAHLGFSGWTEELFVSAVRGASLGLKLIPKPRPVLAGLADERLSDITTLAEAALEGSVKDALSDLLNEVARLSAIGRRSGNDPSAAKASHRRSEEDHRLRAIAATAKEYLATGAPSAAQRLRELLDQQGADAGSVKESHASEAGSSD
jgi:hypothetical protein